MAYAVKSIFYTLQGEGWHAGRAAVFLRFAGCNLWNGLEADRAKAECRFCDTDFVGMDGAGGGRFETAADLAGAVRAKWPESTNWRPAPFVVLTGGEPALQVDDALVDALHDRGFTVAIETNGTRDLPKRIDWVCVSPKAGVDLIVKTGDELKVVYPQDGLNLGALYDLAFKHRFLSPKEDDFYEGHRRTVNRDAAVRYCLEHPEWRLTIQAHKFLEIP